MKSRDHLGRLNTYPPAKQNLINKTRERSNGIQKGKEEVKLSLFADAMILKITGTPQERV